MNGQLAILNVGSGDTKLTFDKKNPVERERAAKIVTDMLKRGYAILIQVGKKKGEPVYQRAKSFDPETCEYIIAGGPDETIDLGEDHGQGGAVEKTTETSGRSRSRRIPVRRVPAESTGAVAVARTAGG